MPVDKPNIKKITNKSKESEEKDVEYTPGDDIDDDESDGSYDENQDYSHSERDESDEEDEGSPEPEPEVEPEPVKPVKQIHIKKVEKQSNEKKKRSKKRKLETVVQKPKRSKSSRQAPIEMIHEEPLTSKQVQESVQIEEKKDESAKRNGKKYNDNNVHYNLYNEAPENIVECRVKISSSCLITSKMIEANGETKGLTYDMAALVICRKMKNGDMFEFTLPLNLAPAICQGIGLIMKENKQFFNKKIPLMANSE